MKGTPEHDPCGKDIGKATRYRFQKKKKKSCVSILMRNLLICILGVAGIYFGRKELYRKFITLSNTSITRQSTVESSKTSSLSENQEKTSEQNDWALILVNQNNPLPEGYCVEIVELSNGQKVDERIYSALQNMFNDMRADGIYPVVASGFRTWEEQEEIMDEKIQQYCAEGYSEKDAEEEAKNWVAIPGTSEHQTGLAVDINADGIYSEGEEVYQWLAQYAYLYGFIKRYPEDKTDITGIFNEPWHYRYVGKAAAEEMFQQNLCLEEYLNQ